ncbi:MAG TPA: leucine--tRNA ligase [Patescibacteria group bacterium]|nr:leucine--tRNA ligase [Patescibacteria group bacterium]
MEKTEANSLKNKARGGKSTYDPFSISLKWQSKWEEEGIYQPDLQNAKRPFYNLMMFPYPSAEGLHIGSIFTFGGVDVYARFKRMQGYDVFEPIGLDGFGIHSENHALKTGTHPFEHAKTTEENFYRQLHSTGISFAWKNKLETYDPGYYRWTQWLFIELFKAGLAYKKKSPVNFCPSCKTVLADEQVIDGKCERCSSIVEKRDLEQWFFKITDYAERLLNNIEGLDWSHKVKVAQKNWIGKKTGINISYDVEGIGTEVTVFTTRPDTNFGATFIAIAPEHPLVMEITTPENKKAVKAYIEQSAKKSDIERTAEGKEKSGVFTGSYAINQLTGYKMPIWVSDFVLVGFGTGALVGVPGHDHRDFEFASKFGLEIKRVVVGSDGDTSPITKLEQVQEEEGKMVNSDFLNGLDIHDATEKIMDYMEEKGYGERVSTYHLRDWLISRQRYWGPPIPMIFCKECHDKGESWFTTDEGRKHHELDRDDPENQHTFGWYPAPELPVELPYVENYKPLGTGKAPLANYPDFYEVKCPRCGLPATRETDVSDTFLDSAWYFLRYLATDSDEAPFPSSKFKVQSSKLNGRECFLPVTMYIGGAEHSVLHLLYARFVTMVLKDLGYLDFEEPFSRFYAHGLIIKDGAKMSKSKGNVINPDVYIKKYGADAVRCYLLFLGPFNQGGDFRDSGMDGMSRFLKRVWKLFVDSELDGNMTPGAMSMMNETVKGVTEDLEELRYNTALSKLMIWYNFLVKQEKLSREEGETYVKLLAPVAPHMTEELWSIFGNAFSVHTSAWPTFDTKAIVHETVKLAVQVNGKLRAVLELDQVSAKDEKKVRELAEKEPSVAKFLEGKSVKKFIYVSGKILNFVAI